MREDSKEFLKLIIRLALNLSDSDIVVSRGGKFFIKLFDNTAKKTINEKDKDTAANRYDGINEENLESFYYEFISDRDNKKLFLLIAREFVNIFFHKKKITNLSYEKRVFQYIQAIISKHLTSKYEKNDEFFNGFSGYIFRIHFKEVFEYIADFILDDISASTSYMIEF